VLKHGSLIVSRGVRTRPKKTHLTTFCGVSSEIQMGIPSKTITNLESAVLKRVFFTDEKGTLPPTSPGVAVVRNLLSCFRTSFLRSCRKPTRWTTDQFIGSYIGRKKAIYIKAVQKLDNEGYQNKYAKIKVFVKIEKTNLTSKPFKDIIPRVISPRSPEYNVELGRFLKPFEHDIYNTIDSIFGVRTVIKGLNADMAGNAISNIWNLYLDPVAIGVDAKRFDQCVSKSLLMWEHSIYLSVYKHNRWLAGLLHQQLLNRCSGYTYDGVIKYSLEGGRMSGDMNTGSGNTLIMCAMMHTYITSLGVRANLINNGDDCVLVTERQHQARFDGLHEWFLQFGFNMVVEPPVYCLEAIEFCQCHPVYVNSGYRLVRNIRVALAKDSSSVHPFNSPNHALAWAGMVGVGGLSLCSGIPIMQEFYKCFIRGSKGKVAKYTDWELNEGRYILSRGLESRERPVTDRTRFSFALAFGIEPDLQVALEDLYKTSNIYSHLSPNNLKYGLLAPFF